MSLIQRFLDRIRAKPPKIATPWGDVTEAARRQAAANMKHDAILRTKVEEIVITEMGGDVARGLKEMRRRYPESYR